MDIDERFGLSGKVILMTGGATKYGRAILDALASSGAKIIIASRNVESLEQTARECGGSVTAMPLDLSREESILSLHRSVFSKFGKLDGLINNAVLRPMHGLNDSTDAWDESMAVNGRGLLLMHRHFGAAMARQEGGGSIVNIASIYGMVGPTTSFYDDVEASLLPDYFFHKAGMINLSRMYAANYGKQKVRVNCVSAGGLYSGQDDTFVERYEKHTFLGRMAHGDEIAGAVIFLLSNAASYITGENLVVDGGFTAH